MNKCGELMIDIGITTNTDTESFRNYKNLYPWETAWENEPDLYSFDDGEPIE